MNRSALLSSRQTHSAGYRANHLGKGIGLSGDICSPLAWTPRDAYRFLQGIPELEESGLIVRVPDWWKAARPPRPVVSVKVGEQASPAGADAARFFRRRYIDARCMTEDEMQAILHSAGGLISLRGKWIEVDRDKLAEALKHWKKVEREAHGGGISFFEGMRCYRLHMDGDAASEIPAAG